MGYRIEKPRQKDYEFYLAALDNSGNYSEPNQFNISHPGIQKLDLQPQDVTNLLASIKIKLPKVYSETSQKVYNSEPTSEIKEILGYRLFIQELDYNTEEPIGEEEIIDYDAQEINEKGIIYYQSQTGKKYQIKVGAYDSVYHPDYNPTLFESIISNPVIGETFKIQEPDIPDGLLSESKLTNSLSTTIENADITSQENASKITLLEDEYTVKLSSTASGQEVISGFGLNLQGETSEFAVLADRFRIFGDTTAGTTVDSPIFAVDSDKDIVYIDSDQITLKSGTNNFFDLANDGLSINTADFKLNKNGTALFSGEVSATQFSLTSGNMTLNDLGISTPEFNLDAVTGSASFSGELQAASGTFSGELSAATGRLGDTTNYVYFDGTNLEINTDTFDLNADGSIGIFGKKNLTIDLNETSPFIKMEDDLGNYTILDSGHLKFYEAGENRPYWYSKRTKYDTVPSGTYIDLTNSNGEVTWRTKPKVQTTIASIQTFYPEETSADVYYECFATDITKEGFKVIGQAYAPVADGNSLNQTYSMGYNENIVPNYSTGNDITRVDVDIAHTIGGIYDNINVTLYYKDINDSTWIEFSNYTDFNPSDIAYIYNYSYTLTDLPLGNYEFRVENNGDPASLNLNITAKQYTYIDQGDVFYMALEGGEE